MYLFTLSYPLLMMFMYMLLKVTSKSSMMFLFKTYWFIWLFPIPVVALLSRVLYSSIILLLGWNVFFLLFMFLVGIPLLLCVYFMVVLKDYFRNQGQDQVSYHDVLVYVGMGSAFLISSAHLIMNHTFFSWVDIGVIPVVSMSVIQGLIFGIAYFVNVKRHALKSFLEGSIVLGASLLFFILSVWVIIWTRESSTLWVLIVMVYVLGFLATILHSMLALKYRSIDSV